jgi:hypothetical protein
VGRVVLEYFDIAVESETDSVLFLKKAISRGS